MVEERFFLNNDFEGKGKIFFFVFVTENLFPYVDLEHFNKIVCLFRKI